MTTYRKGLFGVLGLADRITRGHTIKRNYRLGWWMYGATGALAAIVRNFAEPHSWEEALGKVAGVLCFGMGALVFNATNMMKKEAEAEAAKQASAD